MAPRRRRLRRSSGFERFLPAVLGARNRRRHHTGARCRQLGHAKPTTTLTYYAHWIPSGDKRHIDRLETLRIEAAERVRSARGSNVVAASDASESEVHEMTWSRGRELNPRPTDYESVALPLSYPGVPVWSLSLASTPHHLLPCWFQQLVPRPARS